MLALAVKVRRLQQSIYIGPACLVVGIVHVDHGSADSGRSSVGTLTWNWRWAAGLVDRFMHRSGMHGNGMHGDGMHGDGMHGNGTCIW